VTLCLGSIEGYRFRTAPLKRSLLILAAIAALWSSACYRGARPDVTSHHGAALEEGQASYYGTELQGRRTASGEQFNPNAFTAAHRTLPFGTCLVVQNLSNGRRVRVRINDRGPYAERRIIDVSLAAARELGMIGTGTARVRLYRCDSS
jgi:rare lipoprotein A